MRNSVIIALAAFSLVNVTTSADAATEVRDHRQPPVVRDHRQPIEVRDHRDQPEVRDHRNQPEVRDHRGQAEARDHRGDGEARPKKRACLLGIVCTSNKTIVKVADKITPRPINLD